MNIGAFGDEHERNSKRITDGFIFSWIKPMKPLKLIALSSALLVSSTVHSGNPIMDRLMKSAAEGVQRADEDYPVCISELQCDRMFNAAKMWAFKRPQYRVVIQKVLMQGDDIFEMHATIDCKSAIDCLPIAQANADFNRVVLRAQY